MLQVGSKPSLILCIACFAATGLWCTFGLAQEQQQASCSLLLRGHGPELYGIAAAQLVCSSNSRVPVAINTTHLGQFTSTFSGVQIVTSEECQDRTRALALASAAVALPPAYALLHFCFNGSLTLHQPVVEDVWLDYPAVANSAVPGWTAAVLSFGGSMKATISGGSFRNNRAGPLLLLVQQASARVIGGTIFSNSTAQRGVAAFVTDQASLSVSNGTFNLLTASDRGGAFYSMLNATISISNSAYIGISALGGGCIFSADYSVINIASSTFVQCSARELAGGGLAVLDLTQLSITNSSFSLCNSSVSSGVAAFNYTRVSMHSSLFVNNAAPGDYSGGAALLAKDNAQVCRTNQ